VNDSSSDADRPESWPRLPLAEWRDTYATLHMWTQIVGKVRLALTPLVNHWWNVPLHVDARGLTTSSIPYRGGAFEIRFDFVHDVLVLETCEGIVRTLPLESRSVASFHRAFMEMLHDAGIDVRIWNMPVEIPDPIPFDEDDVHATYDAESARRFWRILVTVERVFGQFRSRFIGKCSPVHFFWGSFDLAVTRFSGRRAPERPGADAITREAYSHEVSSVGFWPGSGDIADAAFYSYAAPEPAGFRDRKVLPAQAFYDGKLGEYILMYEDVRTAQSPSAALLAFCDSTYAAAADLAGWDRGALER
jgi:hypothetical protein